MGTEKSTLKALTLSRCLISSIIMDLTCVDFGIITLTVQALLLSLIYTICHSLAELSSSRR